MSSATTSTGQDRAPAIEVYWRPACPFCTMLRRGLARAGIPTREVNIWNSDPSAAARVRAVAGGNETVPTVFIGEHALVAPSARQVVEAVAALAPHLLPPPAGARCRRWGWSRQRRKKSEGGAGGR